jgi:type I restriction enzyme, S subunit
MAKENQIWFHMENTHEMPPESWSKIELSDVCFLRRETVHPSFVPELPYVGLEHIRSGNSILSNWGHPSQIKSNKNKFYSSDILYGKLRPYLDKSVIAPFSGICSTDILVLVADQYRTTPDFLSSLLHTKMFLRHAISTTSGTNHPRTSWKSLQRFEFFLPPLPEQRAIAHVLSTVRKSIEASERVIAAARELKRSLMKYLFTYGTVAVDQAKQVKLKETEIGEVPEEWEVHKIGDISSDIRSGATPRGGRNVYLNHGIPLIRSQNVLMNKLVLDDVAFIPEETNKTMSRSQVKTGDVLLNITGASLGRVTYVPRQINRANVNQHVCRIRLTGKFAIGEYVSYYLSSEQGQKNIWGMQYGTTRQGLNFGQVRSIPIPIPSILEQNDIANILIRVDEKIEKEEYSIKMLKILFDSFLHYLMTGKVRVRDVTHP